MSVREFQNISKTERKKKIEKWLRGKGLLTG